MSLFHKFRAFTLEWGWEEIVPSGGTEPSGNRGGAVFARDGTGKFCLMAGVTQAAANLTDLWTFDYGGTNQWTQVTNSLATITGAGGGTIAGYADGSGNLIASNNGNSGRHFNGTSSLTPTTVKVAVASGTETALAVSGTPPFDSQGGASIAANISGKKVWEAGTYWTAGAFPWTHSYYLHHATQDTGANTSVRASSGTVSSLGRYAATGIAYHPGSNTLYAFAPSSTPWTLGTSDIIKYDLTAGTGWVAETGVTNNVGAIALGISSSSSIPRQMVWNATEGKFFIFCATSAGSTQPIDYVLTYDPATKIIAQALFAGAAPLYALGTFDGGTPRGNAGTVVVTGSDMFLCTCASLSSLTNARIWRFRRN